MAPKTLCDVFKSLKHDGMYLYVATDKGFSRMPEGLLNSVGKTKKVMTLPLTADKKLARTDGATVLAAIEDKGYYLQLPPGKTDMGDGAMAEMSSRNEKLPRA